MTRTTLLVLSATFLALPTALFVSPRTAHASVVSDDESKTDDSSTTTTTTKKTTKKPSTTTGTDEEIDIDLFKEPEEESQEPAEQRLQEGDKIEQPEPQEGEEENYGGDKAAPKINFDEEEEPGTVPMNSVGQDNAKIYRDYKDKLQNIASDEEIISWEEYLKKYPHSLFKSQIQARIDDLSAGLFEERVPAGKGPGGVDAGHREINLAAPLLLETIDPRTRVNAGFEIGFPNYFNVMFDYEHQIRREWSVHGGVRHRYTGWNIEAGTHYALVKSARTNTIVTGIFDVHANTLPFFPGIRPQVGFGKHFRVGGGLDVQAEAGVDLAFQSPISLLYIGGANVTYHASKSVCFFAETSMTMKNLFWDQGGVFRFDVATFGITFTLAKSQFASLAANAPYSTNYWGYHFGSVMADYNYYVE
jgi:hypothetical protein